MGSALVSHDFISELPRAFADAFHIPAWSLRPDECPMLDTYNVFFKEQGYDGYFCVHNHSGRLERLQKGNPQHNDVFCVERDVADDFKRNLFA